MGTLGKIGVIIMAVAVIRLLFAVEQKLKEDLRKNGKHEK